MNLKINSKNKAISFLEYTIILGVVSVVLIGMNTYIKRGIQGRLKEMTDYFISDQQVAEINPTFSESNTVTDATTSMESFIGGATRLTLSETKTTHSTSTVFDEVSPYATGGSVGQEEGITSPEYPGEEE